MILRNFFGEPITEVKSEEEVKRLEEQIDELNTINILLASDVAKLEKDVELLGTDPEQYIEQEIERRLLALEAEIQDSMNHKWYCIGRMDAYAELGVKVLDAKERGCTVSVSLNEDGTIDEAIEEMPDNLQDIIDEIQIDDLVDIQ